MGRYVERSMPPHGSLCYVHRDEVLGFGLKSRQTRAGSTEDLAPLHWWHSSLNSCKIYRICRNKRPGRLIFRSNKKTFQNPSVLCTPSFEKSLIPTHQFCVLPPLKYHPSQPIGFVYSPLWKITHQKPIGFVYSPLWKITHQKPSVSCTPPFEKSLFLVGAYFGVGVYFGKYGMAF